jgi:hypothetical protein
LGGGVAGAVGSQVLLGAAFGGIGAAMAGQNIAAGMLGGAISSAYIAGAMYGGTTAGGGGGSPALDDETGAGAGSGAGPTSSNRRYIANQINGVNITYAPGARQEVDVVLASRFESALASVADAVPELNELYVSATTVPTLNCRSNGRC